MSTFIDKLETAMDSNKTLLCVGLDSDWEKLPEVVKKNEYPQFAFNKEIIDATHDLVCAYKPNTAFYENLGSEGIRQLKLTCDYLHDQYPRIPIILDAKRGDIGNTNEGYVSFAFDYLRADAITLHPYLGKEAVEPFLKKADKGCIFLCRTSNPGSGEFQDLRVGGQDLPVIAGSEATPESDSGPASPAGRQARMTKTEPLYQYIAKRITHEWNDNNNCLLVVGATYPDELKKVREIAPEMTFLVPGVGAQGGGLEAVLKNGLRSDKKGLIINSSRGIIFASNGEDFGKRARSECEMLKKQYNKCI